MVKKYKNGENFCGKCGTKASKKLKEDITYKKKLVMNKWTYLLLVLIIIVIIILSSNTMQGEYVNIGKKLGSSNSTTTQIQTLTSVTNNNIGDYIDLGKSYVKGNIIGKDETVQADWRVLYVENGTVYAILADYLPNSTGLATEAGLDVGGTYGVGSKNSNATSTLLNGLENTAAWSSLANGVNGVIVTGAATDDLIEKSFKTKYGYNWKAVNAVKDSLYVPHSSIVYKCKGYWLATTKYDVDIGRLFMDLVDIYGAKGNTGCRGERFGIRPMVSLPTNLQVEHIDGSNLWTVITDDIRTKLRKYRYYYFVNTANEEECNEFME